MKVKLILSALTEATSPLWRPIKYALFPPRGLPTLAGYLQKDDEVAIPGWTSFRSSHARSRPRFASLDFLGLAVISRSARPSKSPAPGPG